MSEAPPPATAKPVGHTGSWYRPELDALRLFAFACVFCGHLPIGTDAGLQPLRFGGMGLPLFFMLSGYLIVALLVREQAAIGALRVGRFYGRRVLRIWPLYFVAVLVAALWPLSHVPRAGVVALALFSGNLYILRHGWQLGPAGPLWSLAVEEQFYLVVPWLIAGSFHFRRHARAALAAVLCGVLAVSYGTLLWLGSWHAVELRRVWPNSFVQFQFLAAGGLLALLLPQPERWRVPTALRAAMILVGVALWRHAEQLYKLTFIWHARPGDPLLAYPQVLTGTLLVFLGVLGWGGNVPRWLRYGGRISFGLYVAHQFWLDVWVGVGNGPGVAWAPKNLAAGIALTLLCTVGTAAASYRWLETPFLRWKQRLEVVAGAPAL